MIDIAKQTVEFLYEENGGIPNDLKLPDLDDVKKDMMSLSIDKLRPKMVVFINEHEQQPLFACKQQMKTFGLEGEITRVDKANELVEVETYIESDGIIVRFWYPVEALKKSTNESHSSSAYKMKNMAHLQSELLNSEFILSRLYCRRAYLGLLKWANDDNFNLVSTDEANVELNATLMSNVLLLQDWDIENLLYMMDSLISPCHGSLVENGCDELVCTPDLYEFSPNLSERLLKSNYEVFLKSLADILMKLSLNNGVLMHDLTMEIIGTLREFEAKILQENLEINDVSTLASTIMFPNCSSVIMALKFEKQQVIKYPETLKVVVQPLEYSSKTKNIQHSANHFMKYPCSIKGGKNIATREFPCVMYSTNLLRIYHGGASDSKISLQLDGIPNKILLALIFIDVLQMEPIQKLYESKVYFDALEFLSTLVMKFSFNPILKTSLFYTMARLVKTMKSMSLNIDLKMTERLYEKLLQEITFLNDSEAKFSGTKALTTYYYQAISELCYQLEPLANTMSLEVPLNLDYICKTMAVLRYVMGKCDFPRMASKIFTTADAPDSIHGQYVVVSGLPKVLTQSEILQILRKTFVSLNGLEIVELYCGIDEGTAVIQIQTAVMLNEVIELVSKVEEFHQKSHLDVHQETGTVAPLVVSKVGPDLQCVEKSCEMLWIGYLKSKLLDSNGLNSKSREILMPLISNSIRDSSRDYLKFSDLLMKKQNHFLAFLNGIKGRPANDIRDDLREIFDSRKVRG